MRGTFLKQKDRCIEMLVVDADAQRGIAESIYNIKLSTY
jgi:hypothetical protein